MIGDTSYPKPPRRRWLKVLGVLVIVSGLGLAVLTAVMWGPLHDDEWPGFVPIIMSLGSFFLIWVGAGLWTGNWKGRWPDGPNA